ncbi:MAG: CCA tRNA nucleotidyltransferase [Candidatus Omnitrophota bacterium]
MAVDFKQLPGPLRKRVRDIAGFCKTRDIDLYLVGGCVRDLLLGRQTFDIDVVCPAPAVSAAREFAAREHLDVTTHDRFGTATLFYHDGTYIDWVTARKERYDRPGALPEVEPSSLEEDLFRRDFTLNAVAASLAPGAEGELVDPYDGQKDLRAGVLRVLHGESFRDDPTRILRGVRFAQRFDFNFSPETRELAVCALAEGVWRTVSGPRYFQECLRFCSEPSPLSCFRGLARLAAGGMLPDGEQVDLNMMAALERSLSSDGAWQAVPAEVRVRQFALTFFLGMTEDVRQKYLLEFQAGRDLKRLITQAEQCLDGDPGGLTERTLSCDPAVYDLIAHVVKND